MDGVAREPGKTVRYERINNPNEKIHRNTLGHAFVCKMQIWRAADMATRRQLLHFGTVP